ncbi:hypothetical protein QOT17_020439 [Balamuthia mandrillaris]
MFELLQQLAKEMRGDGSVMFSGNLEIGKDLDYLLLQWNKTILVELIAKDEVWLFKEGKVEVASLGDKKKEFFQTVEHDTDVWYLYDPCGYIPREPLK